MIKIICVGKVKEKYFTEAILEYEKRISKYTKLEIVECNDYSGMDIATILEKERQEIERQIGERDYIISLEIEGEELDSFAFSKKMDQIFLNYPNITFIIGGSYGLHEEIKKRANYHLSFSKLTFPHQLFRVLLLEQIYRSYKILNHESYHK